jgi:hypothetical protein
VGWVRASNGVMGMGDRGGCQLKQVQYHSLPSFRRCHMVCGVAAAPLRPGRHLAHHPRGTSGGTRRVAPYPLGEHRCGLAGRKPMPTGVLVPTGALPPLCAQCVCGWLLQWMAGGVRGPQVPSLPAAFLLCFLLRMPTVVCVLSIVWCVC